MRQLHWLKAPERIAFKNAVLVYCEVFRLIHLLGAGLAQTS